MTNRISVFGMLLLSICVSACQEVENKVVIADECNESLRCVNVLQYCNAERTCVDKKADGAACAVGLECLSGICKEFYCTNSSVNPECSATQACADTTKYCDIPKSQCLPKKADGESCTSANECMYGKCNQKNQCGEDVIEYISCHEDVDCQESGKVCRFDKCIEVTESCWFYKVCDPSISWYDECVNKSKPCQDASKACNQYNECIDRAVVDGLGLGEACDNADKKCMTGLVCLSGVCREESFALDKKPCTAGVFEDRCAGNIIIECDENSGKISVQDCKTNYTNLFAGSTAIPYGANYICAHRTDKPNYVYCVEQCETLDDEKYYCGWDLDDTDIDYSDKFVCKVNKDGIKAYFPDSSEICPTTCGYEEDRHGRCDLH